ncbi:hypothetical protein LTS10_002831 [Elasticomyces elasticus]|nr:hypothetical protein LTS10_002831 [Elasticomyces elasticus]
MATSQLLNLPAELRVQILEHLLVNTYSITVASSMHSPEQMDAASTRAVEPPIARTNHLLRHESLPVYYGKNTFEVYLVIRLHYKGNSFKTDAYNAFQSAIYWRRGINTKHRAMIKNIVSTMVLHMSEDEVVDETCVANVLAHACLRHYRLEFEEV